MHPNLTVNLAYRRQPLLQHNPCQTRVSLVGHNVELQTPRRTLKFRQGLIQHHLPVPTARLPSRTQAAPSGGCPEPGSKSMCNRKPIMTPDMSRSSPTLAQHPKFQPKPVARDQTTRKLQPQRSRLEKKNKPWARVYRASSSEYGKNLDHSIRQSPANTGTKSIRQVSSALTIQDTFRPIRQASEVVSSGYQYWLGKQRLAILLLVGLSTLGGCII